MHGCTLAPMQHRHPTREFSNAAPPSDARVSTPPPFSIRHHYDLRTNHETQERMRRNPRSRLGHQPFGAQPSVDITPPHGGPSPVPEHPTYHHRWGL
eukprot:7925590-Alexandrium_andersonii.AAC.1